MEKIFLCILLLLPAFGYAKKCEITEVKSCEVAAEQGDIDAQIALGGMYSLGMGVKQDVSQAAKWFQKAAEQGDVEAKLQTGLRYQKGIGAAVDYDKALTWLEKAAKQRHSGGQYFYGMLLLNFDIDKAFEWLEKAAAQGHEEAQKMCKNRMLL